MKTSFRNIPFLLGGLLIFLNTSVAHAQVKQEPRRVINRAALTEKKVQIPRPPANRPMVALVLSGGGAKGLAHVGALQTLKELRIPIDLVVGSSMGAIIGGLYAIGYDPDSMLTIIRQKHWNEIVTGLKDFSPENVLENELPPQDGFAITIPIVQEKHAPNGLLPSQRIDMFLSELFFRADSLHHFLQFPTPFACVATDVETGEGRVFTEGNITRAVRGSMAIPGAYSPVELDGHLYFDGGVARNLPVKEAFALGADVVIAVDTGWEAQPMAYVRNFSDLINQAIGFWMEDAALEDRNLATVYIKPDVSGMNAFSFGQVTEILERGKRAAETQRSRLITLRDSLQLQPKTQNAISGLYDHEIHVDRIDTRILDRTKNYGPFQNRLSNAQRARRASVSDHLLLNILDLDPKKSFTIQALNEAIERVNESEQFQNVTYHFEYTEGREILVIEALRRAFNRIGLGAHYDPDYGLSILTGYRVDVAYRELPARIDIKGALRTDNYVSVSPMMYISGKPALSVRYEASFSESHIWPYQNDEIQPKQEIIRLSHLLALQTNLSRSSRLQTGYESSFFLERPEGHRGGANSALAALFAEYAFQSESLEADHWIRNVQHLDMGVAYRIGIDQTKLNVGQFWLRHDTQTSFGANVRLQTRIGLGYSRGDDLPAYYQFRLGGYGTDIFRRQFQEPLIGYPIHRYAGNHLQVVGLGIHYRVYKHGYLGTEINMGRTTQANAFLDEKTPIHFGIGIMASHSIPRLGNVRLGLGTDFHTVRPMLSIGQSL